MMSRRNALLLCTGFVLCALVGQTVNVNFQNESQPSQIHLPPMEGSDRGPVTVHAQWVMTTAARYEPTDTDGDGNPDRIEYWTNVQYYDLAQSQVVHVETPRRWNEIANDLVDAGELAPAPNGTYEPWTAPVTISTNGQPEGG